MKIRDRIKEFRRIRASELVPNPKNWRTHPEHQKNVLKGVLSEIGYADALLARERPDGTLELIDGHLRAETTPDQHVPVLILDLDEVESEKLLTLFDPIASLAEQDKEKLAMLIESIETDNEAIRMMITEMIATPEEVIVDENEKHPVKDLDIPDVYQIIVKCNDETDQQSLYESLTARGYECQIMNM